MIEHRIPKTLEDLFAEVASLGGEVEEHAGGTADSASFDVSIPRAMIGGTTSIVRVAVVGYYRRDGKYRISAGVHKAREAVAHRRAWLRRAQAE